MRSSRGLFGTPGTACLWQCIKDKNLATHRLSDRVLGSLYIAIAHGFIKGTDCDISGTDLAQSFKIRSPRTRLNLGQGLLTPDGKAVVSIPTRSIQGLLELRGSGDATANLPVVRYNPTFFQENYPNWEQWRDELLYLRKPDGTLNVMTFALYSDIKNEGTPPDWYWGFARERKFESEIHHRQKTLNAKTGLLKDTVVSKSEALSAESLGSKPGPSTLSDLRTPRSVANSSGTKVLSIGEIIEERYGFKDRNQEKTLVAAEKVVVDTDSEDEIVIPGRRAKRKKTAFVEPMLSETPNHQRSLSPTIAPIEVHKAAFQAAFRDKSVKRTELFHALLPYITVADAEEILLRCQQVAAVISESKFE